MCAFRSYVPNVPMRLTCLLAFLPQITACLRAYVPTCLRAYVPTSPNFSRVYVLTCEYIFFMPTCLCALNYFVPTYVHFPRAYVPTTTHNIYIEAHLYTLYCWVFSELFDFSFHSKHQSKLFVLELHTPILSCAVLLFRPLHT